MRARGARVGAVLAVAALVLAGCGDDDEADGGGSTVSSTESSTSTSTSADAADPTTEPTESTATTDSSTSTSTAPTSTTGPDTVGGGDAEAFCVEYDAFDTLTESLPDEDEVDGEELKAAFATAYDAFADLAADPPAEIADDVELVRVAYEETNEQVQEADAAEVSGVIEASTLTTEDVVAAGGRVNEWLGANCA